MTRLGAPAVRQAQRFAREPVEFPDAEPASCIVCGKSLRHQRRDARCCSPACRREAARYRRVLAGEGDEPYSTIGELRERRQRRANPG